MASAEAVYRRAGDTWIPDSKAQGPFPGQHGGAVAGVLAAVLEAEADKMGAGMALHCSTLLLRAAPIEPCAIEVATVRSGGRVTVLAATLRAAGKACATAQAIFVRPQEVGTWPLPVAPVHDPSNLEIVPPVKYRATAWFRDTVEIRFGDGLFWLRSIVPVVAPPSPLARVCAHADWASGLSRRDSFEDPKVSGFPNADLSVHLAREARGEWVGLNPRSDWYGNGMGMTDTEIFDVFGSVGRACHTLVLMPLPPAGGAQTPSPAGG